MAFRIDRRTGWALAGAAAAVCAGVGVALALLAGHRGENQPPPPASRGGLVIDPSAPPEPRLDPARALRCFVGGQFLGEMTLAECARRNGVATDALDVGLDANGDLSAADPGGAALTPLPPPESPAAAAQETAGAQTAAGVGLPSAPAPCWRYEGAQWRKLPTDLPLNACVQALFAGRCERPGAATYGRWGSQTLRLVPGRVEISGDNHSFRSLAEQGANCAIPPVG